MLGWKGLKTQTSPSSPAHQPLNCTVSFSCFVLGFFSLFVSVFLALDDCVFFVLND